MAQIPLIPVAAVASALGILSHLAYWIHGEHHAAAPRIVLAFFLEPIVLFAFLFGYTGLSIFEALRFVTVTWWAYVASVWMSMFVYRAFFHRLGGYPGPFFARLSKLWFVSKLGKLDNYKQLDKLHARYGPYVRTGPAEISVIDPEVIELVHGPRSKCTKSTWYDASLPLTSMHQMRDRAMHDKRRRFAWDKAFNMKSLRNYESRVNKHTDELIRQISSFSGRELNATKWFNYYSFDVMGDLSFGKSFNMLTKGEEHYAIKLLHENTRPIGILSPIPWFLLICTKIPFATDEIKRFLSYSEQCVEERKMMKVSEPDIMSYILEAEPTFSDSRKEHLLLVGDSRLIIVAGSDTSAAALTHIFYHLAKDPSQVQKVRAELKNVPSGNEFSIQALQGLHHLNGVINEALRLHPPVPGGVYRDSPKEGFQVGDRFVPGEVTILTPTYSIHRSPECYECPNEFIPERWYSKPEMIKHKSAYLPFAQGVYGCIGKQLALMELRTVVAKLVTNFDVAFAPGEDGNKLLEKTEDCFTMNAADLFLTFTPRKRLA